MTIERIGQISAETGDSSELYREGAAPALDDEVVFTGLYSWRFAPSSSALPAGMSFRTPVAHVRGGFWGRYVATVGSDGLFFRIHASGHTPSALAMDSDPATISASGATLASGLSLAAAGVEPGSWFHLGFHYISGAPGQFTIFLNGSEFYTHSGTLWDNIDFITYGGALGTINYWDNFWLDDAYTDEITTDEEVAAPPAYRFLPSYVTGGYQSEWVVDGAPQNWQAVDDAPGNDGDATVVKTQHADPLDLYSVAGIVLPPDYVMRAVIPTAIGRKGDAALPATVSLAIFDGLNTALSVDRPLSLTYRPIFARFPLQPDGSVWDEASYAVMKYGVKATGDF